MHLDSSQLDKMGEDELLQFISLRIPEGHYLDYKQGLSGESHVRQSHEFLKDVTAFANANGGIIILGVKEPSDDAAPDDQVIGIPDGLEMAQNLERLCASGAIDPRIPGLRFIPIPLRNSRHVLIVQIPSSLGRPHMVNYDKRSSFHIRHSESVQTMTAFEIRQAVITAMSAEDRARSYLAAREAEAIEYFIGERPAWLFQAMPVIPPEAPIDTLSPTIIACLRSEERRRRYHDPNCLISIPVPRPTLEGVLGTNSRTDPRWISEIHRTGYVGVAYRLMEGQWDDTDSSRQAYFIYAAYLSLIQSYCYFCDEVVRAANMDSPFLARCTLLNAKGVVLGRNRYSSDPWPRPALRLPDQLRSPGHSFLPIADQWYTLIHNAFGSEGPKDT